MNPGKFKTRCKLYRQSGGKNAAGQKTKDYEFIAKFRGNWRSVASKELLDASAQLNSRSGTLLTRYYKKADERDFIKINDGDMYRVIGFNHNDELTTTTWALECIKV